MGSGRRILWVGAVCVAIRAVAAEDPPCGVVSATDTLAAAQVQARALLTKFPCVEVHLEPRTYTMTAPLALTAADGNTAWIGAPGTEITAGVDVPPSAWAPSGSIPGAFDLPSLNFINRTGFGIPTSSTQLALLVRGGSPTGWKPMHLARWPNVPFDNGAAAAPPFNWSLIEGVPNASCGVECKGFTWEKGTDRPLRWANAAAEGRLFVHGFFKYMWRDTVTPITVLDPTTRLMEAPSPIGVGVTPGGVWFAYNLHEELDTPGEFVLNRTDGTLSAILPTNDGGATAALTDSAAREGWGCVENGAVVCTTRLVPTWAASSLITITDAHNITLRSLAISGATAVAIDIQGGSNISVEQCTIDNVQTGMLVDDSPSGASASDVSLLGTEIGYTALQASKFTGGNRTDLVKPGFLVENCHFHNFGRFVYTYQPGVGLSGVGTTVRKNLFRSSYHVAILYSGNDHLIELNEFHHVVSITFDSGAIYAGRDLTSRGTVIRHNLFHHLDSDSPTPSPCNAATSCIRQAVYIDDYESGVNITGNIFYQMMNGFFSNKGSNFFFGNNLFVEVGIAVRQSGADTWRPGPPDGVQGIFQKLHSVPYTGEIWAERYPELSSRYGGWVEAASPPPDSATPLGNVYGVNAVVNATGPTTWEEQHGWTINARGTFSLEKAYYDPTGADTHRFDVGKDNVALAHPGFASPDPGGSLNFSLLPDSPLFAFGWVAIPEGDIGPDAAVRRNY